MAAGKPRRTLTRARAVLEAERHVIAAASAGVIQNRCSGYDGSTVMVDGATMRSFGSCGYLALETREELKEAVCRAARECGTQLPFPRVYLQSTLYEELEELLSAMTGAFALVGPSTTLVHMAALPVLVGDDDVVLIDQFAHASLHTAVKLLGDTPVELVRHNRLDRLEARARELEGSVDRIVYVCDGLYSMRGDFAPLAELRALLDRHEKLHLYVDDAHATSWCGRHGRGMALTVLGGHPRVVVALSLNKAFSAAGGALVLPDAATRTLVRRCGATLMFSGPIQPPMLAAAVASARLHLEPDFAGLQERLAARIDHALALLAEAPIPLASRERTPIFQVECDSPRIVYRTVTLLRAAGFFVCPTTFPAVPVSRPGIRFTITMHNAPDEIEAFVHAMARALERANAEALDGQSESDRGLAM